MTEQPQAAAATPRVEVLRRAAELVSGEREQDYGSPGENLRRIAKLWEPILGCEVSARQVALCMLQLKVARIIGNGAQPHQDSYADAAGYIALAWEVASEGA